MILSDFVSRFNRESGFGGDHPAALEALGRLTSPECKREYALKLLELERSTFAIPDDALPALADMLVEPTAREACLKAIYGFGYARPEIDWAGTGITLVMDRVFGDRGGECFAVAVPAAWSLDAWSSDSDLTEDGRVYHHWVAATLPSIPADSWDVPFRWALLSSEMSGTFRWGGHVVSIYRGEVTLSEEPEHHLLKEMTSHA